MLRSLSTGAVPSSSLILASLLLGLVPAWLACGDASQNEPHLASLLPARPGSRVIVISFDALRADALGAYGYERPTSPHLDAFANEAVLFENAYSVAPKTPTSFAAFFTGRRPTEVFEGWRLRDVPTLAGLMRDAGYATAAFANNPQLDSERGFGRGFDVYEVQPELGDSRVLEEAIAWLEGNLDRPVFLWLHLLDPHSPWVFRPDASDLYDDGYAGPYERVAARLVRIKDPRELARVRTLYDGEIRGVDGLFGVLRDRLRELGLYEETILIVTSDHGEEFMEHGRVEHGQLTEENVRIPLMIRHPDLARGARVRVRVSNLDFLPLIAGLVGIKAPAAVVGQDPRAAGERRRSLALASATEANRLAASLIRDDFKLIVHCGHRRRLELFDLVRDPLEQENLASSRMEIVADMERELYRQLGIAGCEEIALDAPGARSRELDGLSPENMEALRQLGYLE